MRGHFLLLGAAASRPPAGWCSEAWGAPETGTLGPRMTSPTPLMGVQTADRRGLPAQTGGGPVARGHGAPAPVGHHDE